MSASQGQRVTWSAPEFFEQLNRLEDRHQRVQADHEQARRSLERLTQQEIEEVRRAWTRYCEVIAELDQTTAEFEALRR
ncbi:MAG TPA: hypothetical protein VLV29_09150 [Steroidobacteraceae bacterium]|nr:hypothetical protein [Steroidobacteraceae bacterium]